MTETPTEQKPASPAEGIAVPPRSRVRAAAYSALFVGAGQLYNKQLEKAVLLWIWTAIVFAMGLGMLLLGILGRTVPPTAVRPPLGDWIADHGRAVFLLWLLAAGSLWAVSLRDAYLSADRINSGEIVIRYPLRRQMVHVLGSQLLGFIPVVGFLFPPAVVAEAIDATHQRRGPDRKRLLREGGQALVEWALTRVAVYALGVFFVLWIVWWVLRAARLAP